MYTAARLPLSGQPIAQGATVSGSRTMLLSPTLWVTKVACNNIADTLLSSKQFHANRVTDKPSQNSAQGARPSPLLYTELRLYHQQPQVHVMSVAHDHTLCAYNEQQLLLRAQGTDSWGIDSTSLPLDHKAQRKQEGANHQHC